MTDKKKLSKDRAAHDAIIEVKTGFDKPEAILTYIEGDDRKTVLEAADSKLKELGHEGLKLPPINVKPSEGAKQGEVGKITETQPARSGGIEGAKDAVPDKSDEPPEPVEEKRVVTGQDVVDRLRKQGHKI